MEYLDESRAEVILSILGTEVQPDSIADPGRKPQHTVRNKTPSNIGR